MRWQTYSNALRVMWQMIYSPAQGWDDILSKNNIVSAWHLRHFVLPLVGIILVTHFIGYMVLALTVGNYSIGYVLVKVLSIFFCTFFTFFVGTLLVVEWTKKLNWTVSFEQLLILNSYSLSAFWLAHILAGLLANYPTLGSFLIFLGITGIYPFVLGAEQMKIMESRLLNRLVAMNIGVLVMLYMLIRWAFSFPLQSLYYLHVFNQ